ncbi:MAG: outer membrane beta-barrel protein [Thermodesulfobacteriota bacterium]
MLISGAEAGETVLSGGATMQQNYDSNIHRTDRNRVNEWTTAFSPNIAIDSTGQYHSLFLKYSPSVVYSHLTDNERWDHFLTTGLNKELGERLSFSVRDTFVRAEDPYSDEESGIELSDSRGRNRYWTNNVTASLGYEYARESSITFSYLNMILDNDERLDDDYVKHRPGISIKQRFSSHWQAEADYFFTKGNFEEDDDLENHAGDLYIYYLPTTFSKFFVHGGYTTNQYQGISNDYDISRASIGFEHQLSSSSDVRLEGGGSFLNRDVRDDKEAFYFTVAANKKFQHGFLSLNGEGGIDEQQFDGTSELDVSRYWLISSAFNYSLTSSLVAGTTFSYREDTYWERTPEEKEELVKAEASLSYTFWRWYTATARYVYSMRDADVSTRCYDDNRVFLELTYNKDFFHW